MQSQEGCCNTLHVDIDMLQGSCKPAPFLSCKLENMFVYLTDSSIIAQRIGVEAKKWGKPGLTHANIGNRR